MLEELTRHYYGTVERKTILEDKREELDKKQKESLKRKENLEKTLELVRKVAQSVQSRLEDNLSAIATSAIDMVFPDKYELDVRFELKRGKTECVLRLVDEEGNLLDPMEENGGGVVDICSFALRMACLELSGAPKILLLDEPFKFVDTGRRPLVKEMLNQFAEKYGVQLIIVTHDEEYVDEERDDVLRLDP